MSPASPCAVPRVFVLGCTFLLMLSVAACESDTGPEAEGDPGGMSNGAPIDTTLPPQDSDGLPGPQSSADPAAGSSDTTHRMHNDVDSKLDAPLRLALARDADSPVPILIELTAPPDEAQRAALDEVGLQDVSITNRIATASATPQAVRDAAKLDFVRSLSLSRERPPLE